MYMNGWQGTNTLAYLLTVSGKGKSLATLKTRSNVMKPFLIAMNLWKNQLSPM
jgi:hypothetical protein